jgi:hypothetical protein
VKFRATKWLKHLALLSVMVFAVCSQTPTGIMISTKKQFHLLGEYQRQPSPSLTNQTLCIHEHYKLDTTNELLTSRNSQNLCCFLASGI